MSDHVILSIVAGVTIINSVILWRFAHELDRIGKSRRP